MFERDPYQSYMMPAHFGARPAHPKSSGWYRDVSMMVIPFVTDRDHLSQYIPKPFRLPDTAVVTVTYACNKEVDWLAGNGYNLIHVSAGVIYQGAEETLQGNYSLVMWENLADPILTGRELQGIPKIYADINDHEIIDGKWHSTASHFGHEIVSLAIGDLRDPTPEEIALQAEQTAGKDHPLSWRFHPDIGGYGQTVNQAVTFPSDNHIKWAQVGTGSIDWQRLTWEQNPTQFHIVNALADLPVHAYLPSLVAKGSVNLLVPDRLPRVLK